MNILRSPAARLHRRSLLQGNSPPGVTTRWCSTALSSAIASTLGGATSSRGITNSAEQLDACLRPLQSRCRHAFRAFIEWANRWRTLKILCQQRRGHAAAAAGLVRHGTVIFVFLLLGGGLRQPLQVPIEEEHPTRPVNPYGLTKLMVEPCWRISSRPTACAGRPLRYFNAAVRTPRPESANGTTRKHLIPRVLDAALDGRHPVHVYARTTPRRTGRASRLHPTSATLPRPRRALEHLGGGGAGGAFNLGQGRGYSVREVIRQVSDVTAADGRADPGQPAGGCAGADRFEPKGAISSWAGSPLQRSGKHNRLGLAVAPQDERSSIGMGSRRRVKDKKSNVFRMPCIVEPCRRF